MLIRRNVIISSFHKLFFLLPILLSVLEWGGIKLLSLGTLPIVWPIVTIPDDDDDDDDVCVCVCVCVGVEQSVDN
jgi:hypothetical protein